MAQIRVYGKTIEEWGTDVNEFGSKVWTQREIAYTDYDSETGEILAVGSEDFSMNRWNSYTAQFWIKTWDGQRRNKGGYKWWEDHSFTHFNPKARNKDIINLYKILTGSADVRVERWK